MSYFIDSEFSNGEFGDLRFFYFLTIIKAAITPGIQPHRVRINTSKSEPQPLSITASGGKIIQRITRQIDIVFNLN